MNYAFDSFKSELDQIQLSLLQVETILGTTDRERAEASKKAATKLLAAIEKHRKIETIPLDQAKKAIMASEKEFTAELREAVGAVTQKLQTYYDDQIELNRLAELAAAKHSLW